MRSSWFRVPATDGPLRITNAKTKTAGPREHMDFILHLLFANEQLKLVVRHDSLKVAPVKSGACPIRVIYERVGIAACPPVSAIP